MRIVVLDDFQGVALRMADWNSLGPGVEVDPVREHIADPESLIQRIRGAQVLVANRERTALTEQVLSRCPGLALVVTFGARNAAIDVVAAKRLGILVCGTRTLGHPTVELTWALIMSLARGIPSADSAVRSGDWQARHLGFDLHGATLGVAGFGRLGSAVAKIGAAFHMQVLVHSRSVTPTAAAAVGATAVGKQELMQRSDVLTLHLPLTPQTRGFIGESELAACKPGLRLVNTSRGPVVDREALRAALEEGRIAGAALDVYDDEPVRPGDPVLALPRTVLTPHLGYVTEANYRRAFGDVVEAIAAFRAGSPIRVIGG